MPSSRQIAFERSSRSRASSKRPRRAYRYGPPRSASASTAARPRSCAQASSSSRNASTSSTGVRPKSIAPPTSFQASIWRRVSPEASACSRPCWSATSCAPRSRAASSARPMSCQASARSASLPIGSKTAIARRAMSRSASGSGGARMKAIWARSISARSSVGSSWWRLASSIASARAASAASSAPAPRSARPSSESNDCAFGGLDRKEPARALEERRRRRELAAIERASSRASEQVTSFQSGGAGLGADPTELRAGEVCLLEVVSDDLLLPGQLRAGLRFDPGSEPRVEIGAELLRHGCIRDVSDQDVVEAEAVVALVERPVRPEQLLARQGEEDAAQPVRAVRRQELRDRAAVEQPPLDRSALEHRPLTRLEPVDAGREERLNRRRHGVVCCLGIVGEHGEHLLDEQRVALGRVDDAIAERGSDVAVVHQPLDQILGLVVAQRGERDEGRAPPGCRPGRPGVEEVGAREAEEQDRGAAREAEDVLEQVEHRRLGPVDVVHHDDERSRDGERLEEPPERPRRLLRRARLVVRTDRAHDQPRRDRPALDVRQELPRAPAQGRPRRPRARPRRAGGR